MPPNNTQGIRKIHAAEDLIGPFIYTEDFSVSAQGGTIFERGLYTLSTGAKFVTLPRPLVSAASASNVVFLLTSRGASHHYVESVAVNSAMGSVLISTVCGFTVSGSGSETGFWTAFGYK